MRAIPTVHHSEMASNGGPADKRGAEPAAAATAASGVQGN